ncbi:MAG: dephospho-CoA kinase [Terriglobia bacterium]|nr:MAG: dephospho-CoA kinase [Terriglobia bacterium]
MLKVGLTGGLACGKSFVGEALARYGCFVIRADELGHEVLAPGGEAYDSVIQEFGSEIVDAGGRIDRRRLAARVFGDPQALVRLNALVHPPVVRREEQLMADFASREPKGIAVVEGAILVETGSYRRFDRLVLVTCSEEQQLHRAMHRDAVTEEEARVRLSRQMPLAEKRKFAHFVIDTSGAKEDTLRQARAVYEELRRIEA